jgi:Fur family peroxide stress response transcriptional regulator
MVRYSKKREAILRTIRSTTIHPSAEWIYAQLKPEFPDLSLATVYRNLSEFLKSGEIISVDVVDSKERFDGNVSPHSHFICDECGVILDVALSGDALIDQETEAALGAKVTRHEVIFRGICEDCLKAQNTRA